MAMTGPSPRGPDFLRAQDGSDQVDLLVETRPPFSPTGSCTPVPPLRIRQSWMRRIKHFLEGGLVSRARSRGPRRSGPGGPGVEGPERDRGRRRHAVCGGAAGWWHAVLLREWGSAADAQHLAAEYVVRYALNRRALAAVALTTDTSILTAAGNDLGFEQIFARQVEALCTRRTC